MAGPENSEFLQTLFLLSFVYLLEFVPWFSWTLIKWMGKKKWFGLFSKHTNPITHANRGENSRFAIVKDKLQPPCTSNEDIISERLNGIYNGPVGLARGQNDWVAWEHCIWRIQYDSVVICRILGSSLNHYFNDCDKNKAFVLEMNAVMPGNWWLCWTQILNLGLLRCQDLATPVWYLAINSWTILEYFIGSPEKVCIIF